MAIPAIALPPRLVHNSYHGHGLRRASTRASARCIQAFDAPGEGNPHDNAMMESFTKTLKVEGRCPMAVESEEDVVRHLPRLVDGYDDRRLRPAIRHLSPPSKRRPGPATPAKSAA